MTSAFKTFTGMLHIRTKLTLVESGNGMTIFERITLQSGGLTVPNEKSAQKWTKKILLVGGKYSQLLYFF